MAQWITVGIQKLHILRMLFLLSPILSFSRCTSSVDEYIVYVGTYTGHGSNGIYAFRFNPARGDLNPVGLVAKTDNPSFITIDSAGRFLYAVNEIDSFQNQPTGAVSVFAINSKSGKLKLLQQISSLGAAPAHLSLDKSGRYLLVANYNGGNVTVFPIGSDGRLGTHSAFVQNAGSSVNPERQAAPHAHFIQVTGDNKFAMVADLGTDKIMIYKFDATTGSLEPGNPPFVKLDPGAGPRHFAFTSSGNFLYVLNELTSTLTVFNFESTTASLHPQQTISTLPDNFTGVNTASEIRVDAKGRFLYVSNRGDNSIAQFSIDPGNGRLTPVDWVPSKGNTPRNFEIDPTGQWLFAANQNSDNIVLFRIDKESGRLIQTSQSLNIVSPVCICFLSLK